MSQDSVLQEAEKRIALQARYSGAMEFHQGVVAGAQLFHQGMVHGARLMAASNDPAKTLAELKDSVTGDLT